jgi:hypothetical protein
VAHIQEDLSQRIRSLEKELGTTLGEKGKAFRYNWRKGKAKFESGVISEHRKLKQGLAAYLSESRLLAVVTARMVYLGIVPFGFLDLFLILYQGICFPVYKILCDRSRGSDRTALVPHQACESRAVAAFTLSTLPRLWRCSRLSTASGNGPQ